MRGSLLQRFGWIEASLRYSGAFAVLEKKAYAERFSLSEAAVSRDQDMFLVELARAEGTGRVVKRNGRLEVASGIPDKAIFDPAPMRHWLAEALGSRFEQVGTVKRAEPSAAILRPVVQAILARRRLLIDYHGRSGPARRDISPHVIVDAAGRLHLRAWDHGKNAPRDFVMTRIISVSRGSSTDYVGQEMDRDWFERVSIEVRVKPSEECAPLRLDYALDPVLGDRVFHKVRRAHLPYLLEKEEGGVPSPVVVCEAE